MSLSPSNVQRPLTVIFGGTFDPIHEGHLFLARSCLNLFSCERILFVPARQNPKKAMGPSASSSDRLQMVKRALWDLGEPRFSVLDWELNREGPSYTAVTLDRVLTIYGEPVGLLLGNEVYREFYRWHRPRDIATRCDIIVASRLSGVPTDLSETLKQIGIFDSNSGKSGKVLHSSQTHWVAPLTLSALPYSSTTVRSEIQAYWDGSSKSKPQGISLSVWEWIKENHLYAERKK